MYILILALKSILNRRSTVLLTIVSLALSVMLLLGVERLRSDMRESFANTLSGTDLVVGARSGSVQLLLYSVFRIGNPTNNVSWESYQDIRSHKLVAWTVPLSLGDSHQRAVLVFKTESIDDEEIGLFGHVPHGSLHGLERSPVDVFSVDLGMSCDTNTDRQGIPGDQIRQMLTF